MTTKHLEVSVDIAAAPERVWTVVSDLTRMPQWSPQCRRMWLLGPLRVGTQTINANRQNNKTWPSASKVVRLEPHQTIAFRTITNGSTWSFDIEANAKGSILTQRRSAPTGGTSWASRTIVRLWLGGTDSFDAEMLRGMTTTLEEINAAIERDTRPERPS